MAELAPYSQPHTYLVLSRGVARLLPVLTVLLMLSSGGLPFVLDLERHAAAESLPVWTKTFHFHDGPDYTGDVYDWLNSTGPSNPTNPDYDLDGLDGITIKKNVPPQRVHHWVLYPSVDNATNITGDVTIHVWARSRGNDSGTLMTTILYDMAQGDYLNPAAWTEIGRNTIPLSGPVYSDFKAYDTTIPSVNYTLLINHTLVVTMCRGDSLNDWLIVMFDQTAKDSFVTLSAREFVSVSSAWTEDASGNAKTVFTDLENPVIWANVSDTFGIYEVQSVNASVAFASNGTLVIPVVVMSQNSSDPSSPPYWARYSVILPQLPQGTFLANVTARDALGSPTWVALTFTVIGVSHFDVTVPPNVVAGENFPMTVSAMDATDSVLTYWVGSVQLLPYRPDQIQPGNGTLRWNSVLIDISDMGTVIITDQRYSGGGNEPIVIRASSGTATGWSAIAIAHSGPVSSVQISHDDVSSVRAGSTLTFTATGLDSCNNVNSTWTPYWALSGSIGLLSTDGYSATVLTTALGFGNITCRDNFTGINQTVMIRVISGELARIAISPAFANVSEGETISLVATGYDSINNVVDLSFVNWYTNTTGWVAGAGRYANFTAGMIPESGIVYAYSGSVTGTVEVRVIESPHGPTLSPIDVQRQYEDVGSWTLSLGAYWHDGDGNTAGLRWLAEGVNISLFFISHDPEAADAMVFYTQPNQNGNSTFRLWVIDELGYRTSQIVKVVIIPVPDAPVFVHDPPTVLYVKFDTPYTFDFTYYVEDVDTPKSELIMTASIDGSPTTKVLFDHLMGNYLFPTRDGVDYFEIAILTVSDGVASSDLKTVVWVTRDTPPSLNRTIDPITVYERCVRNKTIDLDLYFYDLDKDDYLVYDRGFEHIVVEIDPETHIVYISAPEEWSGETQGTFTATDPTGAIKVTTVTVIVIAVNDPPVITYIGDIHVKYNETYTLYLQPYVNDPDNPMDTLLITLSNSHVIHTSEFTGIHRLEFLFPPNLNVSRPFFENYSVTVRMTVSDSEFNVFTDFKVYVGNNSPPSVIAVDPDQLYYGFPEDGYLNNSLNLYQVFADADDPKLYFDVVGGTWTHVRFTIYGSGVVNMTADPNWYGTEVLSVMARDPKGGWAIVQVTVTVTPVNDAPLILPIPDYIVKGGPRSFSYFIRMYLTDPDNPIESLNISSTSDEAGATVDYAGGYIYVELPKGHNAITITIVASDGELLSNAVSFKAGVSKTIAEMIGWPYSFPLVVLAAGVLGYFVASRLPKPHELENVFLIHNDGRLVSHVTREENTNLDKDVVSAMFTAVQEFVRDSFQKGEVGLKKLEIGDKNVIIEKGENAYLALIYTGWPDKQTFKSLAVLLKDVEERYAGRLEKWNGTQKTVAGVEKMLQQFMSDAYRPGEWHEEEKMADQQWVDILDKEL